MRRPAARRQRQAFREDGSGWSVEVLAGLARSLRGTAAAADGALLAAGRKEEFLADCLNQLRDLFKAAANAKGAPPPPPPPPPPPLSGCVVICAGCVAVLPGRGDTAAGVVFQDLLNLPSRAGSRSVIRSTYLVHIMRAPCSTDLLQRRSGGKRRAAGERGGPNTIKLAWHRCGGRLSMSRGPQSLS